MASSRTDPSGRPLLLRYRGGWGMLAWAFHRISGVAIWAFVVVHVIDIYLVGGNPKAYDDILKIYASVPGRFGELLLGGALFYHALNGLRIIIMDFWPSMTVYQRQLWYLNWIIFFVVGIPGGWLIIKPAFGL